MHANNEADDVKRWTKDKQQFSQHNLYPDPDQNLNIWINIQTAKLKMDTQTPEQYLDTRTNILTNGPIQTPGPISKHKSYYLETPDQNPDTSANIWIPALMYRQLNQYIWTPRPISMCLDQCSDNISLIVLENT